jgi:serine-type D-Ala-D-Ala carboxypeptidase (penicillin-binding protein 5/6)
VRLVLIVSVSLTLFFVSRDAEARWGEGLDRHVHRLPAAVATCDAPGPAANFPPAIHAASYVLYDPASQTFLAAHNPFQRRPPSSLTKVATAIVALEQDDLSRAVTVDFDYRTHRRSSDIGLLPGMKTSLGGLFVGMLTASGNDAAREVASEVRGDEEEFVRQMNLLAARLRLRDTRFVNPHGRDAPGQYSTAHDLALLAAEAMRHQPFRDVVGRSGNSIAIDGAPWRLRNTNALLSWYGGATGVKTGFTVQGGPSLAASAVRDGRELIAVIMNDRARFADAAALLDWGFAAHEFDCP